MKKRFAWILIIGLVLITGSLVLRGIRHAVRTDPQKARLLSAAMPVETAPVRVAALEQIIGAGGEVQQIATVTLSARVSGRILEIPVDLGSVVKEGQLLIRMDDRLYAARLDSARERAAKTAVRREYALQQLRRIEALQAQGMGSLSDVEKAGVEAAEARTEEAEAAEALTRARMDMEQTIVRSPVNGIVLDRTVNPEETAKTDQPLLTLGALDHVLMIARVGEDKIGRAAIGQTAEVSFEAYPGEQFTGEVVKLDPKTDPKTRTFPAYIKIANPGLRLKPGLTGFARIRSPKTALVVPGVAIMDPVNERPTVFIVDRDSRAHLREIRTGALSGNLTEVLDGLTEGDVVVTVGQLYLKENDTVRPEPIHAEP